MRTGTAQGLQQQRFRLIVPLVSSQQRILRANQCSQRLVTGATGGGFGACARRRPGVYLQRLKIHSQYPANPGAVPAPVDGGGMQAVIHIDRCQHTLLQGGALRRQQVQQHMGIHAAAVANQQMANGGMRGQQRSKQVEGWLDHDS